MTEGTGIEYKLSQALYGNWKIPFAAAVIGGVIGVSCFLDKYYSESKVHLPAYAVEALKANAGPICGEVKDVNYSHTALMLDNDTLKLELESNDHNRLRFLSHTPHSARTHITNGDYVAIKLKPNNRNYYERFVVQNSQILVLQKKD
jgi:hypothetical protein